MAANPYSIEEIAPRTLEEQDAQANPYSITTLNAEGAQLRATLSDATRADPAQARQADVLARQQGLPQDTVLRNLRDVSLQHAVDEADRRLKTDPLLLQKFKTQPFYAKQAQDDLDAQLEISKLVRNWGKPELGVGSFFGTAAKSLPLAYDTTREGIRTQMYDVLNAAGLIESTPEELRKVRLGLEKAQSAANMNSPNFDDANLSTFERATLQAVHGGFGSTFQQAPGIAASILLANPAPALALMGLQSQTQAYGKYKLRGATPGEAFVGGSLEGAIEVGTEMAPMKYIVKSFGKVGLSKFVAGLFGREVLTEQMATAGQDFVDTMVANPNKTIAQYLEERPGAAYQTLVSTITQSLLMGGASAIVNRMATDAQKSQWAEEEQQKLASMFAVAATSTMKEGNPLSFAETVQEMAAASEGAPKSVFVDARALLEMQQSAGLTDEVFFQMLPSAREKLAEAAIDNGVVELPIGEVTSTVPGSKIEQAFLQQVRMDPTAPNEIERTEAASTAESYLAEQADKVVAEAENAQATLDSADVVRQEVIKQLEATKRFPLEKSQRYADLHAAFFTVLAGKLGITPEQAFKKYGASVRSTISPGQVYNGAPRRKPGEISVEGFNYGKSPERAVLSGANFGRGLPGSSRDAFLNAKDQRLRNRVYFYADKGTGINPEAGVGGFARKAQLNNVYDSNSDPLRLRGKGDQQAFESAVLDAGFDGYLDRLEGTQSAQVIMLGARDIPVERLGPMGKTSGAAVPAPAARESLGRDIIVDALAANKTLPAGSPTIARWQEILPDDIKQALAEAGVFDGDQQRTAYKSELAAAYAAATEAPVYGQRKEVVDANVKLPTKATATTAVDLRKGPPLTGKQRMSTHQVAAFFDRITGKRDFTDAKEQRRAVKQLVGEVQFQLQQEKSGLDWYEEDIKTSFEITGKSIPSLLTSPLKRQLFAVVAGLQSAGTLADLNWNIAAQAFDYYEKTGTVPGRNPANGNLWAGGPTSANKEKSLNFLNGIVQALGEEKAVEWLYSDHTVKELNEARRVWGNMGPNVSGKASDMRPALFVFGEKIGPFVMNINGIHELTVDVWATRTFNRLFGRMTGPDGKIVDAPTEPQRRVAKELFNEVATQTGIKPYQAQSVLWFFEQQLFNHLGTGSASLSFSDGARKFAGLPDAARDGGASTLNQQAPEGPATLNVGLAIPAGGDLTPAEAKAAIEAFGVKVTDSAVHQSNTEQTLVAQLDRALTPEEADALSRALGQEAVVQMVGNEGALYGPEKAKWGDFNPDYFLTLKGDKASAVLGQSAGPALLNIGLTDPDGRHQTTPDEATKAIEALGVQVTASAVHQSDTEPTLVAQLSRPLTPEEVDALARTLNQEAIPQLVGSEGGMFGPLKEKWSPFDARYFLTLKGDRASDVLGQSAPQTDTKAFKDWFGDSKVVDADGKPLVVYHGTGEVFAEFRIAGPANDIGSWFAAPAAGARNKALAVENARGAAEQFSYTAVDLMGGNETVYPVYLSINNPREFSSYGAFTKWSKGSANGPALRAALEAEGYDGVVIRNSKTDSGERRDDWVAFRPEQIKSAIGNRGTFDPNDPNILKQNKPDPLGTFNPSTLEISLLADANLSTFLHETGHFFLEVLGRVAAEPNAPKEIVDDLNATLKWFGVDSIEAWNAMSFAEREPHHEKWAESFEQYLLEGKAPSLALRQSFQRFKEFLLGVYESLKQFLATHSGEASGQDGAFAQAPQTDTKAFKDWFGDSKVVDAEGRPLVVYHGTVADFAEFDLAKLGASTDHPQAELGFFLTPDPKVASGYPYQGGDGKRVVPAYVSIKNPYRMSMDEFYGVDLKRVSGKLPARALRSRLEAQGYDGIILGEARNHVDEQEQGVVIAFRPEQIKSAIGNRGTFDPNDPNILKQGGKPAGPGLNDEVRAIFDRLLATEEQIKEAEAQARFEEIFKSAKDAGMTPDEWKAYQAQHQDATQDALEKMGKMSLADTKWFVAARSKALREAQAAVADKRAEMKAQVTAEVMALPVEQARAEIEQLRASTPEQKAAVKVWNEARAAAVDQAKLELTAALVEANPDAKGIGKGQLLAKNKRAIANQAEAAALEWEKSHPRPKAMPATLEMEVMAERLGYTSADHLRKDMLESPSAKDLIEAMTEQRLLETYGNLVTREGIEQAANEAVYNEARGRFVATELGAMQGAMSKTGPSGKTNRAGKPINVNVITQAAKTFAETVVNRRRIMDLKPAQHTAAASRAAGKAAKLQAEGKTAEAIAAKRDQLLSHFTALYAFRAERNVASQLAYLKKFDKEGVRKSIPQDYLDQIDALLEKIDLRKGTSAKDIARRQSLAKWVDQQHEEGKSPILPPAVLADAQLTSYKQMTVEDFAGLVDSVQNIEHLGRLKGKLLKSADKRAWEAIRDEIAGTIRKFGGKAKPDSLEPRGALNQWAHGFWADHRKLDSLAYQMDGGEINGPMFRSFIRGMNDSGANKASEIAKATQALADLYAPVWALPGGTAGDVRFIPEINNSLSRGGRLSVALNWGNPQNRQRLTQTGVGAPWSEAQVEAILRTLTPTELKFVNDVWAYLDSFWPAVKAKQQRINGVVEEKVEAAPFEVTAADGTVAQMRGGYYPLVYDNDRSNAAAKRDAMQVAKEMLRGAIGAATTRRGHTKARVESVNEPLRLSLSVITQHVEQVVHDLAWHEWMIDANKILADKQIAAAIKEHYGPEILKTMKANVEGIATGDLTSQTSLDNILLQLKTNLSRAVMGWSMTTALLQPFGLAQSIARVGVAPILKGAGRWAGDAAQMESSMAWIREKSSFMEHRAQTMNREINDISQRVRGKSKTMQVIDRSLFILMQKMQLVADVPTWIGMYERATAEGYDEATSVALADEAVKGSQGGGQAQDLANVQRKHPFLTMFYSYFSTTLNLVAEKTAAADFKSPSAVAGWLADMALLVTLPAILPNLLAYAMKGGDDDDPEGWAKRLAKWQASYLLGLFVGLRELGGMVEGFDYAGPPVGRVIVDAGKTATQLAQGDLDEAAVTSMARVMGDLFGIPSTQLIRSYKGWQAWADGDAPVTAVLMGPPPKH